MLCADDKRFASSLAASVDDDDVYPMTRLAPLAPRFSAMAAPIPTMVREGRLVRNGMCTARTARDDGELALEGSRHGSCEVKEIMGGFRWSCMKA